MAADSPRIDELRRRVDKDPASIAFAQLAEEYRRAGDPQEAVRVCRAGLAHHPTYTSARVTLGRALMELGQLADAQGEFEQALVAAPDNLVALRCMAELYQLRGEAPPDLPSPEAEPPPMPAAPPPVEAAAPPPPPPPPPAMEPPPPPPLEEPLAPDTDLDTDIPLDLDAALAEGPAETEPEAPADPQPEPAPSAPEAPPIDLQAAIAAFNEAFGGQPAAAPEPDLEPAPALDTAAALDELFPSAPAVSFDLEPPANAAAAPKPDRDPVLDDLEGWLGAIRADRDDRGTS